jgi:hypothetical protein
MDIMTKGSFFALNVGILLRSLQKKMARHIKAVEHASGILTKRVKLGIHTDLDNQ